MKSRRPYTVAGDAKGRSFDELLPAVSLAITLATQRPRDGEEYRHGVLLNGQRVATAIRHTDGSITALRYDQPGGTA